MGVSKKSVLDILPPFCLSAALGNTRLRLQAPGKRPGGPKALPYQLIMTMHHTIYQIGRILFMIATVLLSEASTLSADEAEFAGNWTLKSLVVPARLREVYYHEANETTRTSVDSADFAKEGERLVDVFFPDPFEHTTGDLTLGSNGTVSGFASGTFIAGEDNRWTASVTDSDGSETVRGYSNLSKDFLIAPGGTIDFAEFQVITRNPTALSVADLAGTWKIATMDIPSDLMLHFFNSETLTSRDAGSSSSPGPNEEMVDTFFEDPFATQNLTLTSDAAGNITGDLDGTFTVNANLVTLSIPDDTPFDLSINASKNVMVGAVPTAEAVEGQRHYYNVLAGVDDLSRRQPYCSGSDAAAADAAESLAEDAALAHSFPPRARHRCIPR